MGDGMKEVRKKQKKVTADPLPQEQPGETLPPGTEIKSPPTSDKRENDVLMLAVPASTPSCPVEERELPSGYGEDRIVLMTRDPEWIFAYWEITPASWRRACTHWPDEQCHPVLRLYELTGNNTHTSGYFDIHLAPFSQSWHIHTGKTGSHFRAAIGVRTPDTAFQEIALSNIVSTPPGRVSKIVDEEWLTLEALYERPYFQPGHSPIKWQKELRMGLVGPEEYPTSPGFLSPMGASPAFTPGKAPAPFYLEINAELVLYGKTSADASVTIAGEPVQVRPDGTFTLRHCLPNGSLVLPIQAISTDGQRKTITPVITRVTYSQNPKK